MDTQGTDARRVVAVGSCHLIRLVYATHTRWCVTGRLMTPFHTFGPPPVAHSVVLATLASGINQAQGWGYKVVSIRMFYRIITPSLILSLPPTLADQTRSWCLSKSQRGRQAPRSGQHRCYSETAVPSSDPWTKESMRRTNNPHVFHR